MVYLVIIHFLREGSHKNDRWGVKTTWNGISCVFPKHRKKDDFSAVYLVFFHHRSTDNNEQVQEPTAWRWQKMKMSEGTVWEEKDFLHSVCLSFLLSVYISPSLSFHAVYDDVTSLLSRYMHKSFIHQPVCNRTIPQFIFHIIVFSLLACHRGLALWALSRRGLDRRADRHKVEGCWASPRGCLAL